MPIPSGLSAQLGIAEETVYGTPVTVTRFYEFTGETMDCERARIESAGLRSGVRVQRSDRWVAGKKAVKGDVTMELMDRSMGLWLKHCMGGVASAQPDAGGSPTVWKHTFTPGDLPIGLTCQVGRTGMAGVTHPFTYHGCRVNKWELAGKVGDIATLKVSLLGEDESTDIALAAANYPAATSLMTFVEGSLTVGGSAMDLREFDIGGDNSLRDDRYFFGSRLRKQPTDKGLREYTGELSSEFVDLTAYNRFVDGTEAALVLLFEGATIANAFKYQTKITCNVRFDGETPQVGGAEEIEQSLPFKCVGNTPATAITIDYQTTDTAP
jgi:hypothetical protein